MRRLANRLIDILYECGKTRTLYDEAAVWSHREEKKACRLTFKLLRCLQG